MKSYSRKRLFLSNKSCIIIDHLDRKILTLIVLNRCVFHNFVQYFLWYGYSITNVCFAFLSCPRIVDICFAVQITSHRHARESQIWISGWSVYASSFGHHTFRTYFHFDSSFFGINFLKKCVYYNLFLRHFTQ